MQFFLKLVLCLHLRNDVAQVVALSIFDLFASYHLVLLDFDKLMLKSILHSDGLLFVINYSLCLNCDCLGFMSLCVIHLILHFAHVGPALGFLLHLFNLDLSHRLLIKLDFLFELFLSLTFVELLSDLSLLNPPVFQVFDLLQFLFAALGIELILDSVLRELFLDPLMLIDLELVLAQFELFLLLF